jgi:hypothetical protein
MARSGVGIAAIVASTARSPSRLPGGRPVRAVASFTTAFMALLLVERCVPFFAGFLSAIAEHLRASNES